MISLHDKIDASIAELKCSIELYKRRKDYLRNLLKCGGGFREDRIEFKELRKKLVQAQKDLDSLENFYNSY